MTQPPLPQTPNPAQRNQVPPDQLQPDQLQPGPLQPDPLQPAPNQPYPASPLARLTEPSPQLAETLRSLTPARVAQRRAGLSLATAELLQFQLAHARARDAVHARLQPAALLASLQEIVGNAAPSLLLESAATDRQTYLQRPDLGRKLSKNSLHLLHEHTHSPRPETNPSAQTLSILLADGLSALALERHAPPLLAALLPLLALSQWTLTPISLILQARVAIGDQVGHSLQASASLVLIGERPGLSAPDSLGAYLTWNPRPGRTDAERNCLSNIRAEGLNPLLAAPRILWLLNSARQLDQSGVALKEPAETRLPGALHG